ncbi:Ribose import ATP-binding protein RbsA [uncultured Clostridium sp.]|uniref:sugar ABC transporter ATP-binding protein n=1 Tax=uncultured Clostridium sp. TaxID=59620 RepID=UPI00082056F6|nr:sugar ABC transporter ATP-binding protein [uncultured Clostridium sp.]SCJ35503.1 Ribose import ATP-binding protein RbsA [uncultured Clostridium sp.]
MNNEVVLKMENIDKRFPGVHALKKCSLTLRKGEVNALAGENGAGKSTLMKILTGIYQRDEGEIIYNGKNVVFKNPRDAQEAGIAIVHQELNLMNHLTAAQNIFIGREAEGLFLNDKVLNKKTEELFKELKLNIKPTELVGNLSVGKQQMIEIAKAISFKSNILILDEPTAALTESETKELFRIMDELKGKGVSMVYISHRMDEIFKITDRITVMRDGEFIKELITKETNMDEVIKAMVGRNVASKKKEKSNVKPNASVVLEVNNLTSNDVNNVSFDLKKGEILGFAGLMGAGRTETARLLFGADPKQGGTIKINGKEVSIKSTTDAVNAGIGYLSEDRKRFGLATGLSVAENAVLANLEGFTKSIIVDEAKVKASTNEYVEKIKIKTPSIHQLIKNLSGGNQQKVVIAKWLIKDADILIFDEPTRGIDVGAKSEIYTLMNELAAAGKSIIMISSELPEILRMSDRVAVMCEGRLTKVLDIKDADQEVIMKYATER